MPLLSMIVSLGALCDDARYVGEERAKIQLPNNLILKPSPTGEVQKYFDLVENQDMRPNEKIDLISKRISKCSSIPLKVISKTSGGEYKAEIDIELQYERWIKLLQNLGLIAEIIVTKDLKKTQYISSYISIEIPDAESSLEIIDLIQSISTMQDGVNHLTNIRENGTVSLQLNINGLVVKVASRISEICDFDYIEIDGLSRPLN